MPPGINHTFICLSCVQGKVVTVPAPTEIVNALCNVSTQDQKGKAMYLKECESLRLAVAGLMEANASEWRTRRCRRSGMVTLYCGR